VHILNVEQPVNKGNAFAGANFPANLVYAAASNKSRSENENIMMSVLDRVIQGCSVLATCAQNVYKELADSPKYLETHHGFINEFESLNAKSPFMPPSTMLFWLKNSNVPYDLKNTIIEDESPLPFFQMGSTSFKLEYGTRGILGQAKSTYSDAPGYVRIIKEHNGSTDSRYHFSESGDDGGLAAWNGYIGLIRYMLDARVYRSGLFGSVNRSLRDNSAAIAADNNCRSGYAALANIVTERQIGRPSTAPYAWLSGLKLHALIRMTESSSIRESKSKIVSIVEKTGVNTMGGDRTDMMIYNIIDLNIVPINFNALRREIPLIHLYNYSYTFDKFISEILNVKDADVNFDAATPIGKYWAMPDAGRTSNDGKIMLARLLINPYLPITFDDYDTRIAKIMRGNLGIDGLDRPKFLSDVLYNGPLFGEIYADHLDYEEGGPAVGDGSLHGRQALIYGMPAGNNSYIKLAVENVWAVVRVVFNNAPVVQNTVAALKKAIEAYATDVYENDGTRKPINVDTAAATLLTTLNNLYTPVLTDTMTYAIAALFAIFTESKDIRNLLLPALRAVGNDINTAVQRSNVQGHLFNMFVPAYNHVAVNGNHLDGGSSFVRKIGVRLNNLGLANLAALQANNTILITVLAINNNAIVDNYVNNTVAIIKAMTTSGNTYSQAGRNLAEDDSRRFYSPNLHYIDVDDNGDGQIKTVPMSASNKQMLQHIGKVRFDTCLFRNIFWLANIQRIIRLCMNRSLHWYDEKIVHKHATTNADITELFGNRVNLSPPRP
jgi:ribosomal protein L28